MQNQSRTYSGKNLAEAQAKFQNDTLAMQGQQWQVVGSSSEDKTKGSSPMFWALIILGFFTIVTWFIAPFAYPRGEYLVTANFQKA